MGAAVAREKVGENAESRESGEPTGYVTKSGVQPVRQVRKQHDIADSQNGVMDSLMSSFISHGNRRRR